MNNEYLGEINILITKQSTASHCDDTVRDRGPAETESIV